MGKYTGFHCNCRTDFWGKAVVRKKKGMVQLIHLTCKQLGRWCLHCHSDHGKKGQVGGIGVPAMIKLNFHMLTSDAFEKFKWKCEAMKYSGLKFRWKL
jgi:hypothetical protein